MCIEDQGYQLIEMHRHGLRETDLASTSVTPACPHIIFPSLKQVPLQVEAIWDRRVSEALSELASWKTRIPS